MSDLLESPPPLSFDDLRSVLTVALRAGQLLLEYGADTHRVEETVHRMGTALGAAWMEIYVTPTAIIASVTNGQEHRTNIRRVPAVGIDLSRIDAINQLSRRIGRERLDLSTVEAELERIAQLPRHYSRSLTVVTVGLACGCFALLFGGGPAEFAIGALGAALSLLARQELVRLGLGLLLQIAPAAFVATLVTVVLAQLVQISSFDVVVPAGVLPLVPGIPLINALSDLLSYDLVSGVTRAAQALLIAAQIAVGVALALDVLRLAGLGV